MPSIQQYQFQLSRSGQYAAQIPPKVYWNLCTHVRKNPKKTVATSTIQSALSSCYPPTRNVTKHDVFNTRVRLKRLMKHYQNCPEFNKFEKELSSNSIFLKNIELDNDLNHDEAIEIMNEALEEILNPAVSSEEDNLIDDYEDKSLKFIDYLHLISTKAKGFQYRLAIGDDNKVNLVYLLIFNHCNIYY